MKDNAEIAWPFDQIIDFKTSFKIHTNVSNFVVASTKTIKTLKDICQFCDNCINAVMSLLFGTTGITMFGHF